MKTAKQYSFINDVLGHIIKTIKKDEQEQGFNVKKIIGGCEFYRNLFAEWFDKSEMRLEELDEKEKVILKEESKTYCPGNRLEWCKAVKFYESF